MTVSNNNNSNINNNNIIGISTNPNPEKDEEKKKEKEKEADENGAGKKRGSFLKRGSLAYVFEQHAHHLINILDPSYVDKNNSDGTVNMKKHIGLIGGISMIIGTMIGSGIFISPSVIMERSDSVSMSLIIWATSGLICILFGLCYCELGTLIPKSGGEHVYLMEAFEHHHKLGELPPFLLAFMEVLLLKPSKLAIACLTFGKYILTFIEHLDACDIDPNIEKLLACLGACFISFINIWSSRLGGSLQILFAISKLLFIMLIIIVGIVEFSKGNRIGFPSGFDDGELKFENIAIAYYGALWAYDGWNNLNLLAEEVINPQRNLPIAILTAIPLVTICYVLVNLSYLTVMDKETMISETATALRFGELTLNNLNFFIPLLVALSSLGTCNSLQFTSARITYAAGRDGHMPDVLSYVHGNRLTPTISISFNLVLSIVMIVFTDLKSLVDFISIVMWAFYGLTLTSVIILRYTMPDAKRSFKVPIILPIIGILISLFLVFAPIMKLPEWEYLLVLAYVFVGVVFYYPFVHRKYQPKFMRELTICIQKVAYVVPTSFKDK